jgi:3',5'-cyclic AMP phosphodiesterase CpdA
VGEFREYFREAFGRSIVASQPRVFPFAKLVGGVLIVGLNSVARYSGVKNPLGSNGKIDSRQLRRLDEILSSPLFKNRQKVVLVHHHFSRAKGPGSGTMHTIWNRIERQTMKLRGKKELLKMFWSQKVGIVLHGHDHRNAQYARSEVRFLNGGGSVIHEAGAGLRVNLVRVWSNSILTEIHRLPEGTGLLVRTADVVARRETAEAVAA